MDDRFCRPPRVGSTKESRCLRVAPRRKPTNLVSSMTAMFRSSCRTRRRGRSKEQRTNISSSAWIFSALAYKEKAPRFSPRGCLAKPPVLRTVKAKLIPGSDLLSHPPARAVPSAVAGLTSVFGMGTGVTLLLWPPGNLVSGISSFAGEPATAGLA